MQQNEPVSTYKRWWAYFWAVVAVCIAIFATIWFSYLQYIAYTNDAYVEGNQIFVTPLQDGIVTNIHTDDTYLVDQGQLILELDDTDAKIALSSAQDNLAKVVRQVCGIFHRTFSLQADIEARLAELVVAKQDWEHRIDVIEDGGVSLENLQHAEATLKSAFFNFKSVESLYLKEKALIEGTTIQTNPIVQEAVQKVRDAVVRLYRTKIYAPNKGLIAQRSVQVGMYVKSGTPLMSVIPLDQLWVNANYKETQMEKMRIGQDVKITADLYGSAVVYHGNIVGLPGGAGNAFSLLPPQNLSGNWIKIVQRLPVRVALRPEEVERFPLRIGLTMKATANLRSEFGEVVPKTTKGPTYATSILVNEDEGASCMSDAIIEENIDANLKVFEAEPFTMQYTPFEGQLDQLFKEEVQIGREG